MKPLDRKVTFGLIVGTRGFFDPQLAREARRQLLSKLHALGYSYVILPETATAHSAIETRADVLQEAVSKYLGWGTCTVTNDEWGQAWECHDRT